MDKPDGGKRFVLNLKRLNEFITTEHFKLEDVKMATKLVSPGDYMAHVDLKDAYFLIPMHRESRKYLRFRFGGYLYEFVCLPFGLSTAPFIFTKVLKPVVNSLRIEGLLSVIYLDDILWIGQDYESCKANVDSTISLLQSLGFIINEKKSNLTPNNRCRFLGFILDSKSMTLELPESKRKKDSIHD